MKISHLLIIFSSYLLANAQNPGQCTSTSCLENGLCINNSNNTFYCLCRPGFSGPKCEFNERPCDSNPCKNGNCVNGVGANYTCSCKTGYIGKNCDLYERPCDFNPCKNGDCINGLVGNYTCMCKSGYVGKNCEINLRPCDLNPCTNGDCTNAMDGTYTCICKSGYVGKNCEIYERPCDFNPCKNGECTNYREGDYKCTCEPGYFGKNCENNDCKDANWFCGLYIGLIAGSDGCKNDFFGLKVNELCKESCNLCPNADPNCTDQTEVCRFLSSFCQIITFFDKNMCRRTCKEC